MFKEYLEYKLNRFFRTISLKDRFKMPWDFIPFWWFFFAGSLVVFIASRELFWGLLMLFSASLIIYLSILKDYRSGEYKGWKRGKID